MQLWDTAGQERYKTITNTLYNNVLGIVLCYSVDNRNSFTNIEHWMKQIKNHVGSEVAIVLVGNKSDIENRAVNTTEGQYLA
jgi:small GTP-binding protein